MLKKNMKRLKLASLGLLLTFVGVCAVQVAQADNTSPGSAYYVSISKACGTSGLGCGDLSIYRQKLGAGNKIHVDLYHYQCLGFRSGGRYRWIRADVVSGSNRFYVKIDRPRIKFKLRGRFVGPVGSSRVKGTLSFRNVNRKCGFSPVGFRQNETGPAPSQ